MNPSRNLPADAGSDDPWEQLAEDLFGLEFGKEHAATAPVTQAESTVAAPVAFESPAAPAIGEEAAPQNETPAAVSLESPGVAPVAEIPVRPATPSAQDSYWDALANWKWDDSEAPGGKGKPAGPRRDAPQGGRPPSRQESRPAERPARSAPSASASAPAAESRAGVGDDFGDFGLGVDSSASVGASAGRSSPTRREAPESAHSEADRGSADDDAGESDEFGETDDMTSDEDSSESADPAAGDEGAPRKRRRRRRRRRSRSSEGQPAGGAASDETGAVPGEDWEKPSEPVKARGEERPRAPQDGGRERDRRDEESRPPRRGRRDRRGHSAPVAGERHEFSDDEFGVLSTADEPANGGDDSHSDHPADDDGDLGEPAVNYADVPTWEEAISYLLHPNQVQVETNGGSGTAAGSGSSSESSRQNRHYGGRRR
jgi:ribonuclease E